MSLMNCIGRRAQNNSVTFSEVHYLMGTFVRIDVSRGNLPGKGAGYAFDEIKRLDSLFSRFRADSQISMLNLSAHMAPQKVSHEVFAVIRKCLSYSEKTGGAFDITTGGLSDIWHKAGKESVLPEENEIALLLSALGAGAVVLDEGNETVFFKNGAVNLDLGAAVKGYAIDKAVSILEKNGIKKGRINLGGNVYFLDKTEDKAGFIGIRDPMEPEEVIVKLPAKNKAVSTSAGYERFFEVGGKRYCHIIDPANGRPADNSFLSATVVSPSGMDADILSTSAFVLGPKEGMRLIEETYLAEGVLIIKENGKAVVNVSSGLKTSLVLL